MVIAYHLDGLRLLKLGGGVDYVLIVCSQDVRIVFVARLRWYVDRWILLWVSQENIVRVLLEVVVV